MTDLEITKIADRAGFDTAVEESRGRPYCSARTAFEASGVPEDLYGVYFAKYHAGYSAARDFLIAAGS